MTWSNCTSYLPQHGLIVPPTYPLLYQRGRWATLEQAEPTGPTGRSHIESVELIEVWAVHLELSALVTVSRP